MQHAKKSGLVVGTISNVYPRYVDQNLPLLGLHRDLDFATTSREVGVLKPDPAIFADALRRASHVRRLLYAEEAPLRPDEMLHVGDDLQKDYLAARRAGLRALLYDPKGMAGTHADLSSDDVIRSLDEVPARLDSILAE